MRKLFGRGGFRAEPTRRWWLAAIVSVFLLGFGTDLRAQGLAPRHRDHPLVGTIWSTAEQRALSTVEFHERLAQADLAVLGEIHDNPDHHRLQADILRALIDRGRRPAVVFEMIPQDLRPALEAHLRDRPDDLGGLGAVLRWEERGWPDWEMYKPLAELAATHRLPMRAGDLAADTLRMLGRQGAAALGEDERARLGLARELPADAQASLDDMLFESHCGLMPRQALAPMRLVQRARDGAMADAILGHDGPTVLIAGGGHARRDWGVPAVIRGRAPSLKIASVALVEVVPGMREPAPYQERGAGAEPVHDYLLFTAGAEREDPCAALTRHMQERSGEKR